MFEAVPVFPESVQQGIRSQFKRVDCNYTLQCVCGGNKATGQKAHQDVKQLQPLLTFQGSPQTQTTFDLWVQGL